MEKEISLENVIDMIIETYDPKILDNPMITTKEMRHAFYKLAETENALGGPRKVLAELISNHKNNVQKPMPKFIGGPLTLTCHFSKEYNKMIYIFGEYHTNKTDCGNFSSTNKMLVEDFIYQLIDKTDVFIDIFLEINAMERNAKEYKSYDGISNSRSISELFNKLQKCIPYNTRHDNACRLSRVSYFDIRKINDNSYNNFYRYIFDVYHTCLEHIQYIYKLEQSYNKDEISKERYDQLEETKIKETFDEIKKIIELNNKRYNLFYHLKNDNVENFWLERMYNNIYVIHELKKITDEELFEKITDFFEQNIRTFVYSNKENWNDNIDIILDTKTNMNDYITSVNIIFKPCIRLLSRISDMYTICRMFKDFDLERKPYEGADYKDQPKRANNIIIYSGDAHSIFYREFLDKMQFKKISANSKSLTCVDLRNFPLPFFSISAINKYYLEKEEDAIVKQLKDEQEHIIELYESRNINKQDSIKKLSDLVLTYREYKFDKKLKTQRICNKLNTQFEDLRKKLAEIQEKPYIRSFLF